MIIDKNFQVRLVVGLEMFIVSLLAIYLLDGTPFKIIFGLFSLVSAVELFSFLKKKCSRALILLVIVEFIFLICGVIFAAKINIIHFWYMLLGIPGYDIFAYFFGKLLGGKIFKKSRPFPHISKNKTWEGTIFGLLISTLLVTALMAIQGSFETDFIYIFCGGLALVGDLFESFLKRKFNIKDSNEIIIKNPFFKKIELLVGGSKGHGGFLDRIDSAAFSATILLLLSFVV